MKYPHEPVMVNEVIGFLINDPSGTYVDCTVGSGGHSEVIYKKIASSGCLICLDRDAEAVGCSKGRLSFSGGRVTLVNANYAELKDVLNRLDVRKVHGVLLDLGMSSFQLDKSGRGFSFNRDEPLDMRMDLGEQVTARQLVNNLSAYKLEKILKDYGEERKAKLISRAIEKKRNEQSIDTSAQLADIVRSVVPPSYHPGAKDPATRTFQALRIAVNRELENLEYFLSTLPSLLHKGGRAVFLTYHSLEDRLVKQTMAEWGRNCNCPPDFPKCVCEKKSLFKKLQKKAIRPTKEEININPRARSAILRAAERI